MPTPGERRPDLAPSYADGSICLPLIAAAAILAPLLWLALRG